MPHGKRRGRERPVQLVVQVRSKEDGVLVEFELPLFTSSAEQRARKRADLERAIEASLLAIGSRVDFEARPLVRLKQVAAHDQRHTRERNKPVHRVTRVGRPLACVRVEPDDVLLDIAHEPRAAHSQPDIALRRHREREIALGLVVIGVVEDVGVDASVGEREGWVQPEGPDSDPDVGGIGLAGDLSVRRTGVQQEENGGPIRFRCHVHEPELKRGSRRPRSRPALLLKHKRAVAGRIDLEVRAAIGAVDQTAVRFPATESVEGD